jgi:hypothetical protein
MKAIAEVLTRRVGTAAAAYLVGKLGIPEDLAMKLIMAGTVFLGVAADISVAALLARFK